MITTILVPTDGSSHADKAVLLAADIAAKYGSHLILLNVISELASGRPSEGLKSYAKVEHVAITERDVQQSFAREVLERAEKAAWDQGAGDVEQVIEIGDPARIILDVAKQRDANLIVMGSRGLGGIKGLMLGSVSHKISNAAECTCVTVR